MYVESPLELGLGLGLVQGLGLRPVRLPGTPRLGRMAPLVVVAPYALQTPPAVFRHP